MSSISAIQQNQGVFGIFATNKQNRTTSAAESSASSGADTVQFSEEALALLGKTKSKAEEDEEATDELFTRTAEETQAAAQKSLKETGMSMFAIMLESLFLADLEENAKAAAQSAEDGMPRQKANPLTDSEKAAEIKKVMNDVASGKADISDIPKAMATGSGGSGSQTGSPATKKTGSAGAEPETTA